MAGKTRVLIVDDEKYAREKIKVFLKDADQIEIVGECSNGQQAIESIHQLEPQIVLLDIHIPKPDAFEVISNIELASPPIIILVTAFDEYAMKALEYHVFDYLLKPYTKERLLKALQDAQTKLDSSEYTEINKVLLQQVKLLDNLVKKEQQLKRILIKEGGRIYFLKVDDIMWIESSGDYVKLFTMTEEHVMREKLKSLESKLDTDRFFRVHRKTIVNIEFIKEMRHWSRGEYLIELSNKKSLVTSLGYKENVKRLLQKIP